MVTPLACQTLWRFSEVLTLKIAHQVVWSCVQHMNVCAPGKGVIAGAWGAVGIDLEVCEAQGSLNVIGGQCGQCAPE